ncbi:MAG: hypothetical protein Q8M29_04140 [Bacteroidota bacterium]|nr:hypothetical protein [Bacteroidota bacterium]
MKKFYLLTIFVLTTIIVNAQFNGSSNPSSEKAINVIQLEKQRLVKLDETTFSAAQKTSIINYINTLTPRVVDYNFTDNYLYVSLESDFHIFDLMEGIKVEGISLAYYEEGKMHFVNNDIKIETWSVK